MIIIYTKEFVFETLRQAKKEIEQATINYDYDFLNDFISIDYIFDNNFYCEGIDIGYKYNGLNLFLNTSNSHLYSYYLGEEMYINLDVKCSFFINDIFMDCIKVVG